jgi:ubiquinone/menaquinone biosynthesis C-methylase UbiE
MRRTNCSSCGYNDLHTFLDLGLSPIADAYTATRDEQVEMHPLQLAVCTGCWLVQLLEVVDPKTLFGTGYSFYSSASAPLSDYHAAYAEDIFQRYPELTMQLTVEVGCNDGDMLRWFRNSPHVGVDPATGPIGVARRRDLNVVETEFTFQVAEQIRAESGPAGIVIANHVLAHVADVAEVLRGVAELLDSNGVAFVEVQYLPDLLTANAFDLVYHEHRNFFSLTSLEKAAQLWGLHVVDAQLTNRQGGSLRVELRRTRAASSRIDGLRASEAWLTQRGAYDGFQGRIERVRTRLRDLLVTSATGYVAGYGAPAKATTLLNFCGVDAEQVGFTIDTTTAKQGRYIPGTGVPIRPPDVIETRRVDTFLLLAWNYAPDIMRREIEFTRNGGRWIVPIPIPTLF